MPAKKTTRKTSKNTTKKKPTPKTTTKKTAKKSTASTSSKKQTTKQTRKKTTSTNSKVLESTTKEKMFHLANGKYLKSIKELGDSLEKMDKGIFNHHVNNERNDFANWVELVFKDKTLAKEIRKEKDIKSTRVAIYKHLLNHALKKR